MDKLTIRQLIKWVDILNGEFEGTDQYIALASVLSGKSVEEIESLPYEESNQLVGEAKSVLAKETTKTVRKIIWVKGRPYKALTDLGKFSAQRYLDLEHYNGQDKRHKNLHKTIALLYQPLFNWTLTREGNYRDRALHQIESFAEKLLDEPVGKVYGVVFFFKRRWESLGPVLETYLNLQQTKTKALILEQALISERSKSTMDGIST